MDGISIDEAPHAPSLKPTPNKDNQSSGVSTIGRVLTALSRPHHHSQELLRARSRPAAALRPVIVRPIDPGPRSQAQAEDDQSLLHRRGLHQRGARRLRRLHRLGIDRQRLSDPAHSVRAMACPPSAISMPPSRRWTRRCKLDATRAQLLFHAGGGLRRQEGFRQGDRRSRRGHSPRRQARRLLSPARHGLSRQRRPRPGAHRVQREGQSRSDPASGYLQARRSLPHAKDTTCRSRTTIR